MKSPLFNLHYDYTRNNYFNFNFKRKGTNVKDFLGLIVKVKEVSGMCFLTD